MVEIHPLFGYISRMYIRNIQKLINQALKDSPAILINGARQVGKSTLAHHFLHSHKGSYITLDDESFRSAAVADPQNFLLQHSQKLLIIDEIQRAPELLLAIKLAIDQNRSPGRFLLTGSANVLLLPRVAESLAGRIEIQTLWPLSQGEFVSHTEKFIDVIFSKEMPHLNKEFDIDPQQLQAKLLSGGYPEVISRSSFERRQAWFKSYVATVIHREIKEIANIERITDLSRLLQLMAIRSGTLLNHAELSRTSTLPQTTLKRYLALFEAIFILHTLPAWTKNLNKRLVKSPKIFLNDTGLISYLLGINKQRLNDERHLLGSLLESFVIIELKKQSGWSKVSPYFFHYRTHTGSEIDLLLEEPGGRLVGIEVKASTTVVDSDFKNLKSFAEETGNKFLRGIVLYTGSRTISFGKNFIAMPISALWELK